MASIIGLLVGGVAYELFACGTFYIAAGLAFAAAALALRLPRLRRSS